MTSLFNYLAGLFGHRLNLLGGRVIEIIGGALMGGTFAGLCYYTNVPMVASDTFLLFSALFCVPLVIIREILDKIFEEAGANPVFTKARSSGLLRFLLMDILTCVWLLVFYFVLALINYLLAPDFTWGAMAGLTVFTGFILILGIIKTGGFYYQLISSSQKV